MFLDFDRTFIQKAPTFVEVTELSNTQFVQKVNSYFKVEGRRHEARPETRTGTKRDVEKKDVDKKPDAGTRPSEEKKTPNDKKPIPGKKREEARKPAGEEKTSSEKKEADE